MMTSFENFEIDLEIVEKAITLKLASNSFADFVIATNESYIWNWHHILVASKLELFAQGKIKKLAIFLPPQHGKSELSSRRLPAYLLGKDPNKKVAIVGYEQTFTSGFNRDIQRIITSDEYKEIFPNTKISERNNRTIDTWLRNSDVFEIIGHKGSLRTVGVGGPLTGNKVDIMIIDDPVKNMVEAESSTIQLRNYDWYLSVAKSRLHANSQSLILQTRWNKEDLAGKIFKDEKDWQIVTIPAIKENNFDVSDLREIGEVLWEKQRTKEETLSILHASPKIYYCQHQQQPQASKEFLIFCGAQSVLELPNNKKSIYGLDWGFTNSKLAICEVQIEHKKIYTKELLYKTGITNNELIEWIYEYLPNHSLLYCDGAEPKSVKELNNSLNLRTKGIQAISVTKFPNSVNTMISALKDNELFITLDSINFIYEKDNWQWSVGIDGNPSNNEIDKSNHLAKALMYAYWGHTRQKVNAVHSQAHLGHEKPY